MKIIRLSIALIFIPFWSFSQDCNKMVEVPTSDFNYMSQFARVETGWYDEWLAYTKGEKILPDPLPLLEKWDHPYMKHGYTAAMHEDAHASDVSNLPGPVPKNVQVQYFHVLQKGGDFSGMAPTYIFLDDTTMVTLSFGRANTTLLLLDIKDTIHLLDHMSIPGRGNSALELAGKKGRSKIFSNTAGGAYSYLSGKDRLYIPGANNNILRIKISDRKLEKNNVQSINLKEQIESGNLVDKSITGKDALNLLTALMPDVNGNIWFTSRQGVIGLIHRTDKTEEDCPKVYATFVGKFGIKAKIDKYYPDMYNDEEEIALYRDMDNITPEIRKKFRDQFMVDKDTREEIQNSFSVGKDGVYIVTNFALYKFRFNEQTKKIELDPKWEKSFENGGDPVYDNDRVNKPGHLNAGSGTTPTLMDDSFVAIGDNDTTHINICVYSQETGELVFKHKLFEELSGSAVENSIVAYNNSFIAANQYGYSDPFKENDTEGGIARFDFNKVNNTFELAEGWPASGLYDCKTATPKLSAASGMIYVYNRSDNAINGHFGWQLTGIDYLTGNRIFYIKPDFNKGEFNDNIGMIMKWGSLGSKNYDRKVFNNLWGTFTFGPGNSFYIGAYRGFIRISSE